MINWEETKNQFNRFDLSGFRPKVVVTCDVCKNRSDIITIREKNKIKDGQIKWKCPSCVSKERWQSESYRNKMEEACRSDEFKQKVSKLAKQRWNDGKYGDEYKKAISNSMLNVWKDQQYRETISGKLKEWNADPANKEKLRTIYDSPEYREKLKSVVNSPEYKENRRKTIESPEYKERQRLAKLMRPTRPPSPPKKKSKVAVKCKCGKENMVTKYQVKEGKPWRCASCVAKSKWQDESYRKKMNRICNTDDYKQKVSKLSIERWKDPKYVKMKSKELNNKWNDEEFRKMIVNKAKERWEDPEYKEKMAVMRGNQSGKPSSIQKALYSILDDLKINYYSEYAGEVCKVGPYWFDCVIPRQNDKTLLIECQGDYWHNLPDRIVLDGTKATYIEKYHSDQYELKYLWEHEFKCKDKIIELIKYWLNITQLELIDFGLKDVEIKNCQIKEYKLLLSKYHYLPNASRGGEAFGAYFNNQLIACCVFSSPIRQNIDTKGYNMEECRELSRLCIHPRYQKKNFASWFVSRCIKLLDPKYKLIISYCDTTFNHDGAVYKACNFTQDEIIRPDYWYVSKDGWIMHKRTLYDHAVKSYVVEKEFADKYGYKKVYGKEKLRFIYTRQK